MGMDAARITAKVQGRDITLDGPLSRDEIRDRVWWWQVSDARTSKEREDRLHEYDDSHRDVIATLGGYYEVSPDRHTPEAEALVDLVYTELNPDA
ncbi:hypothetical protein JK359_17300 [Streptomyces actinomycinicus]|uniref:Uncharacterized protein n=1 Tax=Streptomyces actinomycinicus TaxID=1695166 RepID=A0A937EIG0_9ACTN|nr:hypothetical protein [Streptomyces actinomycinicus]MBL1083703.1 hypothetical protein [Streptomyces actinomycinicus]